MPNYLYSDWYWLLTPGGVWAAPYYDIRSYGSPNGAQAYLDCGLSRTCMLSPQAMPKPGMIPADGVADAHPAYRGIDSCHTSRPSADGTCIV